MNLIVKERSSGDVIASGIEHVTVQVFEGNWYFHRDVVNMEYLRVTERTYTCPYKGLCYWVDVENLNGVRTQNVAWIAPHPKPGYEFLKDQVGFYASHTYATLADRK
jgi:uncharacterized protein (DUF427 family)